jgi:glucosamine--fructose-6-phosphate aminotransferase (isomerizing)
LYGADLSHTYASLETAMQAMQAYLDDWQAHYQYIGESIGQPGHLVLTGRGASLASVFCGALIIGEAGSSPAIGMPAGQFRHGPLEMCSPDLSVIVLAGPEKTRQLNQRLAIDIAKCGANSFWLGPEIEGVTVLPMPLVDDLVLPLAEMLPLQLLTIYLAEQAGLVPGVFKFIGKVTLEE